MSGSAPFPARLRRLFETQQSTFRFPREDLHVAEWIRASQYPEAALGVLAQRTAPKTQMLWAPHAFLHEPHSAASPADSNKPPQPPPRPPQMPAEEAEAELFSAVQPVLNASYLHTTSLFSLLMSRPLPTSPLTSLARVSERLLMESECEGASASDAPGNGLTTKHYVMHQGRWRAYADSTPAASWLLAVTPALNVGISCSSAPAQAPTGRPTSGEGKAVGSACAGCVPRLRVADSLATGDYLEGLIWPTACSGDTRPGLTADHVWVDTATVEKYGLTYYSDAIWTPLHEELAFHAWQRRFLTVMCRQVRRGGAWGQTGGGACAVGPPPFREFQRGNMSLPDWLGELYVRPG